MSLTVVGSVALDTVETPAGTNIEGLGGAATYFSLAAANYCRVHVVGVVGDDFPQEHVRLLVDKGINLSGLERVSGKTFRWRGKYHDDLNQRDTLETQLNVFEDFHPKLPEAARQAPFLFLANIHPTLQGEVLGQAEARLVGLDTMNLWINIALEDLKAVLRRVDVMIVNDGEVRDLTGESNLYKGAKAIVRMGPRIVVIKKGEHGCLLYSPDDVFSAPAFPLEEVVDPTGAGDAFAGGFMGHVVAEGNTEPATLRRAVIHGSVVASFTCEAFGPDRLAHVDPGIINDRFDAFRKLAAF